MNKILKKAINIANNMPRENFRLCSIVTDKRDNILSIGINNSNKSHPRQAYYAKRYGNKHKIFLHAEMEALIKLNYNDSPYKIYVARVGLSGIPRKAKPCSICEQAIKDSKIKIIIHT